VVIISRKPYRPYEGDRPRAKSFGLLRAGVGVGLLLVSCMDPNSDLWHCAIVCGAVDIWSHCAARVLGCRTARRLGFSWQYRYQGVALYRKRIGRTNERECGRIEDGIGVS
jgi:hypothetical protein